jgi:Cu/Ag efflux protein CusF
MTIQNITWPASTMTFLIQADEQKRLETTKDFKNVER